MRNDGQVYQWLKGDSDREMRVRSINGVRRGFCQRSEGQKGILPEK